MKNILRMSAATIGLSLFILMFLFLYELFVTEIYATDYTEITYISKGYNQSDFKYVNRVFDSEPEIEILEEEVVLIAKMLYGECGSSWISKEEKAACAWIVCNRVDSEDSYFPDSIEKVIKQKGAFYGYKEKNPVTDELYEIAKDVLTRWTKEKNGEISCGRIIPSDYLWFTGNGKNNIFRNAYKKPYTIWDFSLESPYN